MAEHNAHVTVGENGELLPSSRVTVDGIAEDVAVPAHDPLTTTDLFWDRVSAALDGFGFEPARGSWRNYELANGAAHFHAFPKESR